MSQPSFISSVKKLILLPLLLSGLLVPLSSCGGGGGGGGGGGDDTTNLSDWFNSSWNYVPDQYFMAKGFARAELQIEGSSYILRLSCLSASPASECVVGNLDAAQSSLQTKSDNVQKQLIGEWEQYGGLNSVNRLNGIRIETAEGAPVEINISGMAIDIGSRSDNPWYVDNTIVLHGQVISGSLTIDGVTQPLVGASVRLIYTIADGYINTSTHNPHSS